MTNPRRLEVFGLWYRVTCMLTDKDIQRMMQVFPTTDKVRSIVQEELVEVKDNQLRTLNALDRLATAFEKLNIEYAAISEQLSRHERWIREIAKKAKVSLSD